MAWICAKAALAERPADFSPWHEIFERHGCGGTVEHDNPPAMSAYFFADEKANDTMADLGKDLLDFGAAEVSFDEVAEEDWAETWKQFFKPREVGKRFLIKPSWEDIPPTDKLIIELDPGQAFGTGEHPTTRLCIALMEEAVQPGDAVADIGCGSGVLSIAAAKLGASRLFATEIDPAAAEAARANFLRNGVEVDLRTTGDIPLDASFDVVVSNIVSAVLIKLAPDIARITNPGGLWLLSGVIEANWQDVADVATGNGFDLVSKREDEGWVAALLRKR